MAIEYSANNELTSFLIKDRIPEFVREDHPTFVRFIEHYYDFLQSANTETYDSYSNTYSMGPTYFTKRALEYIDFDTTDFDRFLNQFKSEFASTLPKRLESSTNIATLYKNLMDFYRAKGTEDSFKMLFRILYGEEIELYYPKDDILTLSGGTYSPEKRIRVQNTDNIEELVNRKIYGATSGVCAVVERVVRTYENIKWPWRDPADRDDQIVHVYLNSSSISNTTETQAEFEIGETLYTGNTNGNHVNTIIQPSPISTIFYDDFSTYANAAHFLSPTDNRGSRSNTYTHGSGRYSVAEEIVADTYGSDKTYRNRWHDSTISSGGGNNYIYPSISFVDDDSAASGKIMVVGNEGIQWAHTVADIGIEDEAIDKRSDRTWLSHTENIEINPNKTYRFTLRARDPYHQHRTNPTDAEMEAQGSSGGMTFSAGYSALAQDGMKYVGSVHDTSNSPEDHVDGRSYILAYNAPFGLMKHGSAPDSIGGADSFRADSWTSDWRTLQAYVKGKVEPGNAHSWVTYSQFRSDVAEFTTSGGTGYNSGSYDNIDQPAAFPNQAYYMRPFMMVTNVVDGAPYEPGEKMYFDYFAIEEMGTIETLDPQEGYYLDESSQLSTSGSFIRDNEYYQNYAYEIRTKQDIKDYKHIVESTVHPVGLKQFGAKVVEPSKTDVYDSGIVRENQGVAISASLVTANTISITDLDVSLGELLGYDPSTRRGDIYHGFKVYSVGLNKTPAVEWDQGDRITIASPSGITTDRKYVIVAGQDGWSSLDQEGLDLLAINRGRGTDADLNFRTIYIVDHVNHQTIGSGSRRGERIPSWVTATGSDANVQYTMGTASWITTTNYIDKDAKYSPDGTKIVFSSDRDTNKDIYVMDADGSDITQLTDSQGQNIQPSWSPDGKYIVFSSSRTGSNYNIHIMKADGSNTYMITSDSDHDFNPSWQSFQGSALAVAFAVGNWVYEYGSAPPGLNGTKIAYDNGTTSEDTQIYTVDTDGDTTSVTQITLDDQRGKDDNGREVQFYQDQARNPVWSPDGTEILFMKRTWSKVHKYGGVPYFIPPSTQSIGHSGWGIWKMLADGSNHRELSTGSGVDLAPSWSADGNHIAFISNLHGVTDPVSGVRKNPYIMDKDGLNKTRIEIFNEEIVENSPISFNPDGTSLIYTRSPSATPGGSAYRRIRSVPFTVTYNHLFLTNTTKSRGAITGVISAESNAGGGSRVVEHSPLSVGMASRFSPDQLPSLSAWWKADAIRPEALLGYQGGKMPTRGNYWGAGVDFPPATGYPSYVTGHNLTSPAPYGNSFANTQNWGEPVLLGGRNIMPTGFSVFDGTLDYPDRAQSDNPNPSVALGHDYDSQESEYKVISHLEPLYVANGQFYTSYARGFEKSGNTYYVPQSALVAYPSDPNRSLPAQCYWPFNQWRTNTTMSVVTGHANDISTWVATEHPEGFEYRSTLGHFTDVSQNARHANMYHVDASAGDGYRTFGRAQSEISWKYIIGTEGGSSDSVAGNNSHDFANNADWIIHDGAFNLANTGYIELLQTDDPLLRTYDGDPVATHTGGSKTIVLDDWHNLAARWEANTNISNWSVGDSITITNSEGTTVSETIATVTPATKTFTYTGSAISDTPAKVKNNSIPADNYYDANVQTYSMWFFPDWSKGDNQRLMDPSGSKSSVYAGPNNKGIPIIGRGRSLWSVHAGVNADDNYINWYDLDADVAPKGNAGKYMHLFHMWAGNAASTVPHRDTSRQYVTDSYCYDIDESGLFGNRYGTAIGKRANTQAGMDVFRNSIRANCWNFITVEVDYSAGGTWPDGSPKPFATQNVFVWNTVDGYVGTTGNTVSRMSWDPGNTMVYHSNTTHINHAHSLYGPGSDGTIYWVDVTKDALGTSDGLNAYVDPARKHATGQQRYELVTHTGFDHAAQGTSWELGRAQFNLTIGYENIIANYTGSNHYYRYRMPEMYIDDVKFWNRRLTEHERNALFSWPHGVGNHPAMGREFVGSAETIPAVSANSGTHVWREPGISEQSGTLRETVLGIGEGYQRSATAPYAAAKQFGLGIDNLALNDAHSRKHWSVYPVTLPEKGKTYLLSWYAKSNIANTGYVINVPHDGNNASLMYGAGGQGYSNTYHDTTLNGGLRGLATDRFVDTVSSFGQVFFANTTWERHWGYVDLSDISGAAGTGDEHDEKGFGSASHEYKYANNATRLTLQTLLLDGSNYELGTYDQDPTGHGMRKSYGPNSSLGWAKTLANGAQLYLDGIMLEELPTQKLLFYENFSEYGPGGMAEALSGWSGVGAPAWADATSTGGASHGGNTSLLFSEYDAVNSFGLFSTDTALGTGNTYGPNNAIRAKATPPNASGNWFIYEVNHDIVAIPTGTGGSNTSGSHALVFDSSSEDGGVVLQVGNSSSSDVNMLWAIHHAAIPYANNAVYRGTIRWKSESPSATRAVLRAGFVGLAANGYPINTQLNWTENPYYYPHAYIANGVDQSTYHERYNSIEDGWITTTGYWGLKKGVGEFSDGGPSYSAPVSNLSSVGTDIAFMRPFFAANYESSENSTTYIDYIMIEEVQTVPSAYEPPNAHGSRLRYWKDSSDNQMDLATTAGIIGNTFSYGQYRQNAYEETPYGTSTGGASVSHITSQTGAFGGNNLPIFYENVINGKPAVRFFGHGIENRTTYAANLEGGFANTTFSPPDPFLYPSNLSMTVTSAPFRLVKPGIDLTSLITNTYSHGYLPSIDPWRSLADTDFARPVTNNITVFTVVKLDDQIGSSDDVVLMSNRIHGGWSVVEPGAHPDYTTTDANNYMGSVFPGNSYNMQFDSETWRGQEPSNSTKAFTNPGFDIILQTQQNWPARSDHESDNSEVAQSKISAASEAWRHSVKQPPSFQFNAAEDGTGGTGGYRLGPRLMSGRRVDQDGGMPNENLSTHWRIIGIGKKAEDQHNILKNPSFSEDDINMYGNPFIASGHVAQMPNNITAIDESTGMTVGGSVYPIVNNWYGFAYGNNDTFWTAANVHFEVNATFNYVGSDDYAETKNPGAIHGGSGLAVRIFNAGNNYAAASNDETLDIGSGPYHYGSVGLGGPANAAHMIGLFQNNLTLFANSDYHIRFFARHENPDDGHVRPILVSLMQDPSPSIWTSANSTGYGTANVSPLYGEINTYATFVANLTYTWQEFVFSANVNALSINTNQYANCALWFHMGNTTLSTVKGESFKNSVWDGEEIRFSGDPNGAEVAANSTSNIFIDGVLVSQTNPMTVNSFNWYWNGDHDDSLQISHGRQAGLDLEGDRIRPRFPYAGDSWMNGHPDGPYGTKWSTLDDANTTHYLDHSHSFYLGAGGFANPLDIDNTSRDPFSGYIAEVLIFNEKLSLHDVQKVEGYLAHKYGMTVGVRSGRANNVANLYPSHPYYHANNHPPEIGTGNTTWGL